MSVSRRSVSRRSVSRLSVAAATFSAAFALATTALATGNFPGALESDLTLDYQPPCSLCHEGGKTGGGTVNTPFGKAMRARGLVADDENSLSTALGKMMDDAVDSDEDGTTDVDELVAGADPNVAGDGSLGANSPQYGCGAQIAPGSLASGSPAALGLALLTAIGLAAQLRTRRARR